MTLKLKDRTISARNLSNDKNQNPRDFQLTRKELHESLGGKVQGGISPSKTSDSIFLFSDPVIGPEHGYMDGYNAKDGYYHYTGEGQKGDQLFKSGNKSVLNHKQDGRSIHIFEGAKGSIEYLGEFELAEEQPYYLTDAPETGDGPIRQIIVFRFKPVSDTGDYVEMQIEPSSSSSSSCNDVALEQSNTEKYFVAPKAKEVECERTESALVKAFVERLSRKRTKAIRNKIQPEYEAKPLFTDIYLPDRNLLIECKGSATREAIRMAIGQLFDYQRFMTSEELKLAVLLPSKPRRDLLKLLTSLNISAIWKDGEDFMIQIDDLESQFQY